MCAAGMGLTSQMLAASNELQASEVRFEQLLDEARQLADTARLARPHGSAQLRELLPLSRLQGWRAGACLDCASHCWAMLRAG